MVFATGIFLLLLERRYKPLIVWSLSMFIAVAIYVSDYTPGSGVSSSINWLYLPGAFVAKIGAIVSTWPTVAIKGSIIWGTLICLVVIPALVTGLYNSFQSNRTKSRVNPELLAYFCFIFLTIGLIAFFRSTSEILLENRFKIYAVFSAVLFYLLLLNRFPRGRKIVLISFTLFASFFYINSYFFYTTEVVNKHSRYVADTYNWPRHRDELCNFSSIEKSLYFLEPAYEKGYWIPPNPLDGVDKLVQNALQQSDFRSFPLLTQHFLHEESHLPQLFIGIEDFPLRRQHMRDNLFIVLHDEKQHMTYLTGTLPKVAGWRRLLTQGTYFGSGFSTVIPLNAMKTGQYRLGSLLTRENQPVELIMTTQIVSITQDTNP
ncbi:hypothetical protein GCM10027347_49180 [Larkinella harenae]